MSLMWAKPYKGDIMSKTSESIFTNGDIEDVIDAETAAEIQALSAKEKRDLIEKITDLISWNRVKSYEFKPEMLETDDENLVLHELAHAEGDDIEEDEYLEDEDDAYWFCSECHEKIGCENVVRHVYLKHFKTPK